jgi:hypothetical protein
MSMPGLSVDCYRKWSPFTIEPYSTMSITISMTSTPPSVFAPNTFNGWVRVNSPVVAGVFLGDYFSDDAHKRTSVFMSGDVEPWSIRGGLAGDFLVRTCAFS